MNVLKKEVTIIERYYRTQAQERSEDDINILSYLLEKDTNMNKHKKTNKIKMKDSTPKTDGRTGST